MNENDDQTREHQQEKLWRELISMKVSISQKQERMQQGIRLTSSPVMWKVQTKRMSGSSERINWQRKPLSQRRVYWQKSFCFIIKVIDTHRNATKGYIQTTLNEVEVRKGRTEEAKSLIQEHCLCSFRHSYIPGNLVIYRNYMTSRTDGVDQFLGSATRTSKDLSRLMNLKMPSNYFTCLSLPIRTRSTSTH